MSNKSEKIDQLAAALAKVQSTMKGAVKDAHNPFFKSRYADLESVWDACRKPLNDNSLAVVQTMGETANGPTLTTTLVHASGQWIEGSQPVMAKAMTPQDLGSAITYARRYGLAAIVGVVQIDDDAEQAQRRPQQPQPAPRGPTGPQGRF